LKRRALRRASNPAEWVEVPDLYCPFAPTVNAHAEEVREETLRWASSFGLLVDENYRWVLQAAAVSDLAGRCHPSARREDLCLISDFYAWMFLQDDCRDESEVGWSPGRLSDDDRRSLEVLEGDEPTHHDGLPVHALGDLRDRFYARAPGPGWMRRFVRGIAAHFDAATWEATNRARGIVPDLDTYVSMRPLTAGLGIDDELIELASEVRLFAGAKEHPTVRRLTVASHRVVCWANDLISLRKELASGDVHNLVLVLARAEDLVLQEAVDRAARMHDAEVREFVRLSSHLPSFGAAVDEHLRRYVAALQARMQGNLDWSREAERYRQGVEKETNSSWRTQVL
jgi:5-epi-alpha-selinene synthase